MKYAICFLFLFTIVANSQVHNDSLKEILSSPQLDHRCIKSPQSLTLQAKITEGSGLVFWNNLLWTHNDGGTAKLFALDTATAKIVNEYRLPLNITDWEDLSQDADFFYLGDFGNNFGQRAALSIFRIEKKSLLQNQPKIDTIKFSWPETIRKGRAEKINFDCEAMAVVGDSIYLFSKEWKKGRRTRIFSLPKQPGSYSAKYLRTLQSKVIVTGASYDVSDKKLVLCGHNFSLRPFIMVFPEFDQTNLFVSKGVKYTMRKRFRQVEGIATCGDSRYFVVTEDFQFLFIHTRAKVYKMNLLTD